MNADRAPRYALAVAPGLRKVHRRGCSAWRSADGACRCRPAWEAWVWDPVARRKLYRTFPTEQAAKRWRRDTAAGIDQGRLTAAETPPVREAGDALIAGIRSGAVRNRAGRPFKPSVVEGYAASLRDHVYPAMGARRLADVRRAHVQQLVDDLVAAGRSPSTVRNVVMPLRIVFRRAIRAGLVAVNPTAELELPAPTGRRDR